MLQILIVDAQAGDAAAPGRAFASSWYRLKTVSSADEAVPLALANTSLLAMVVADDLPGAPFCDMEQRLHGVLPGLPLIALTRDTAVPSVVDLMRCGAVDVLVRPLMEVSLVTAVSRLFMGRPSAPTEGLANRESQVFAMLGEGYSTSDMAKHLHLSIKTVDGTLIRLRSKLGCSEVSSLRRLAVARRRQMAVREAVINSVPVMGHDAIDAGHSGMLTQLCRLERALGSDDDFAELSSAAEALLVSAHDHDQVEVDLMRGSDYPDMAKHRAEHAILLDEILALKSRMATGRASGSEAFRAFVLHWLVQHTQRFDRPLVAHLRRQR
jgi:hemerythrin-like metal-binding protein